MGILHRVAWSEWKGQTASAYRPLPLSWLCGGVMPVSVSDIAKWRYFGTGYLSLRPPCRSRRYGVLRTVLPQPVRTSPCLTPPVAGARPTLPPRFTSHSRGGWGGPSCWRHSSRRRRDDRLPRRTANVSAGEEVGGGSHGANCEPADHRESTSDHQRHSY